MPLYTSFTFCACLTIHTMWKRSIGSYLRMCKVNAQKSCILDRLLRFKVDYWDLLLYIPSLNEKHNMVGRLIVRLIDTGNCLSGPLILYRYIFWKAKYIPNSFVFRIVFHWLLIFCLFHFNHRWVGWFWLLKINT